MAQGESLGFLLSMLQKAAAVQGQLMKRQVEMCRLLLGERKGRKKRRKQKAAPSPKRSASARRGRRKRKEQTSAKARSR